MNKSQQQARLRFKLNHKLLVDEHEQKRAINLVVSAVHSLGQS